MAQSISEDDEATEDEPDTHPDTQRERCGSPSNTDPPDKGNRMPRTDTDQPTAQRHAVLRATADGPLDYRQPTTPEPRHAYRVVFRFTGRNLSTAILAWVVRAFADPGAPADLKVRVERDD